MNWSENVENGFDRGGVLDRIRMGIFTRNLFFCHY
jgi:hypothetical protein